MFTVYVLYSSAFDRSTGYTSNFKERLASHNMLGNKGWTIRFRPWSLVYTEQFQSKTDAIKREKELKSGKGREFVWKIIKNKSY